MMNLIKKVVALLLCCIISVPCAVNAETNTAYSAIQDTYASAVHPAIAYSMSNQLILCGADWDVNKIFISFRIQEQLGEYDRVLLKMTPEAVMKLEKPAPESAEEAAATASKAAPEAPEPVPAMTVFRSETHEWHQLSLTWNNAPKAAAKIADTGLVAGEVAVTDVTAYVKGSRTTKGYVAFVITAADKDFMYTFPSVESLKAGAPTLVVEPDALRPSAEEQKKNTAQKGKELVFKQIKTKYPSIPEIPALPEDFDIDEYTTTRYKPWMLLYHLTSAQQIKNRYYGGDAGQMGWSMAISPHDPDLMLLGSDTEAVWRSENGGVTWRASNKGLKMIGTTALTFDPYDENLVYVLANTGTGLDNSTCGIYKSEDKGKTWRFIMHLRNNRLQCLKSFAFGPKDSNGNYRIYYISNDKLGLFASDDQGNTWQNIGDFNGVVTSEIITHEDLVIIGSEKAGLFVSRDKGETWTGYMTESYPKKNDGSPRGARSITINPVNPKHWVIIGSNSSLYSSFDAGETWELTCDNSQFSGVYSWHIIFGAPNERGECIIYAAIGTIQRNLRYSTDYGKTFNSPVHYNTDAFLVDNWGWGCEPMAVHPTDPYTAFMFLDGEPYVTHDGGKTLRPTSSGYSGFRAVSMTFDPKNEDNMFFTFTDRGFSHSLPSGRGEEYPIMDTYPVEDRFWIRQGGTKSTGGIDFNWSDPSEVWASIGNGSIMKSTDGGRTFTVKKAGVSYTRLYINQQNPDIIYCGNWVTYDHGETWKYVNYQIRAMSPVDNNIIYGRVENNTYRSKDAGRTWEQLTSSPIKYSQGFTCDWEDEDKVYIGTNAGIYIVDGDTSRFISPAKVGGKMCYKVAQDPKNTKHLVTAGNDQSVYQVSPGIYESFDDGASWTHVEGFEGTADAWSVYWHPTLNKVFFGTSNGTWVYEPDNYYNMQDNIYRDVTEGYYAKDKIEALYNDGILYRYHDGYFRPDECMRRERFADMLKKALDLRQIRYEQTFSDIDRFNPNYVNVQALYENGFITESANGLFRPKDSITYDEAAAMLYSAVRKMHIPVSDNVAEIKDYVGEGVAEDVRYAVYQLKKLDIIDDTVKFQSDKAATNADLAVMFYNFMQLVR